MADDNSYGMSVMLATAHAEELEHLWIRKQYRCQICNELATPKFRCYADEKDYLITNLCLDCLRKEVGR